MINENKWSLSIESSNNDMKPLPAEDEEYDWGFSITSYQASQQPSTDGDQDEWGFSTSTSVSNAAALKSIITSPGEDE